MLHSVKEELYLRERRGYCASQYQSTDWESLLEFTKFLFSHLRYSQSEYRKFITHNLEPHWLARCDPLWQSELLKYLYSYLFVKIFSLQHLNWYSPFISPPYFSSERLLFIISMEILRHTIVATDGLSWCTNFALNASFSATAMCIITVNFLKLDFNLQKRKNPQILDGIPETKRIRGRNVWRLDDSINMDHIGIRC